MLSKIYTETTSEALLLVLEKIMSCPLLNSFRLAGGTGLSLQLGHRISEDIDLFTDHEYGTVDFKEIHQWLDNNFDYYYCPDTEGLGFGVFSYVGNSKEDFIKLDMLYPIEQFTLPAEYHNDIRFASVFDIAAMKLDMITKPGRKKDFWDLSALLDKYNIVNLFESYKEMFPYKELKEVKSGLIDFSEAEEDEDPICFMNKVWELIKLDFIELHDTL